MVIYFLPLIGYLVSSVRSSTDRRNHNFWETPWIASHHCYFGCVLTCSFCALIIQDARGCLVRRSPPCRPGFLPEEGYGGRFQGSIRDSTRRVSATTEGNYILVQKVPLFGAGCAPCYSTSPGPEKHPMKYKLIYC